MYVPEEGLSLSEVSRELFYRYGQEALDKLGVELTTGRMSVLVRESKTGERLRIPSDKVGRVWDYETRRETDSWSGAPPPYVANNDVPFVLRKEFEDWLRKLRSSVPRKSGKVGRPSAMSEILAELDRRVAAGSLEGSVGKQARELHTWFQHKFGVPAPMKPKTIENRISAQYRAARHATRRSGSRPTD